MFTGLIRGTGEIVAVDDSASDRIITVRTNLELGAEKVGASICCSGVCLTALSVTGNIFTAQMNPETRAITTAGNWSVGTSINLEPSLRMGDPLGGHIVTGHVDGRATISTITPVDASYKIRFTAPEKLLRFIAQKGSVAIDGVSMTVNAADKDGFEVMVIPHTWGATIFHTRAVGDDVNIEVDLLARYIARINEFPAWEKAS